MTGLRRAIAAALIFIAGTAFIAIPASSAKTLPTRPVLPVPVPLKARLTPFGSPLVGSRLPRPPSTTDARTGKPMPVVGAALSSVVRTTAVVPPRPNVQPPPSANCQSIGGSSDDFACYVTPGVTYDLPVSSTIPTYNSNYTCSAASPEFYWVSNPPRGVTVTLLNWTGASDCGSTITGTVRVSFSAQAPWNTSDAPDFTFKVHYTLCTQPPFQSCASGDTGFGPTGGTRYAFATPVPPRTPAIPERACGRCNGTTIGKPIDVATGEVWNEKTDLALSGPFGLSFTRFYGSQTAGSADLGSTNWLHTYAAALDVSSVGNGTVAYYDNRGMPYYFSGLAKGGSSYDNPSGSTLALSSDGTTFTLTTFSGETSTFNASGQLLVLHDRIGNAQTVTRDASNGNRIASVADSLGRQLCFYYDVASRIVGVAAQMSVAACPTGVPASTTTTPVVTLGYNTSTMNCSVNSLCAVTEPDGNTWTYQYSTDPNYPYNLSMVLDPLQDPEESNSFSGNRIAHQESGSCNGSSPCGDTGGYVNIVYPSAGSSTASITDGLGRTSTISYDPNTLLLTQISGPVCRCGGDQTRNYAYDASQRLTSESDDGVDGYVKHTTTYAYARDVGGQAFPGPTSVVETVDTAGTTRTTTLVYYPIADARHDLAQTITQPAVDQSNSTMTTSDTYSLSGLLLQRKKTGNVDGTPTAYTWNWTYDARGRILTQTSPRTDLTATTTFQYFPDTSADAAAAGQLRSVTDALNHSTQYASVPGYTSYTPFGEPQSITDPNGVSTEFAYDARGRLVSSTMLPSAEGDQSLVTQLKYDAAGRRTQQILPARNGLFFGYDTSNRLTQIIRADASLAAHERMLVTYNVFDQASTVAAQGCSVPSTVCSAWATTWNSAYVYSATTSDLAQVTNADGTAKKVTYTAQGALATLNDENHTTGNFAYTYDLAGRRLSETRVLAGVTGGVKTQYAYDLHDNVTSVTDPNGNVTKYHYDDFDRVTKETSPVSGVTIYAYDADDNLTSTVNANGTTATYTYDALDRMLKESDTKGSASALELWTYDDPTIGHFGIGRLATMSDPSGSAGYAYDRRGNLEVVNQNVAGHTYWYGFSYDINGNRYEITYPDDTIVAYTFDFADRPYSVQQTAPPDPNSTLGVTRRTHSIARLRTKGLAAPYHPAKSELPTRPRGPVLPIVTLPRGRTAAPPTHTVPLSTVHPTVAAGPGRRLASGTRPDSVLVAAATYAPFGPLTSTTFGNGAIQTMSYDLRYLPLENKLVANGMTIADHFYVKDHVGNVTAISDALDAGYSRNFAYDDLNRITAANTGSKLWGATGNGYTYDSMGNMLTLRLGATRSDSFTYRNGASGSSGLPLISSVLENGFTRNVSFDPIGSQLSDGSNTFDYGARELLGSSAPDFQAYIYDGLRRRVQVQTTSGQQRIMLYDSESRLLAESTLSSSTPTTIAYDYVSFGDRPVAQLDASGTHWTYTDHLGTPLLQTDGSNTVAVTWQAEQEPYGKIYAMRAADVHQPLRLPGQESQQFETGANGSSELSYNGARWYRPGWGDYTQPDPLKLNAGMNLYVYGDDNPITEYDASGLASCAYGIAAHVLTCTSTSNSRDVRRMGPQYVWSGKQGTECKDNNECANRKDAGPIPPGSYSIDPDHWKRRGFYNLNSTDPQPFWASIPHLRGIINSIPGIGARSGFELHLGSNSIGCITGDKTKQQVVHQFRRIEDLLNKEMGHNFLTVGP